LFASFSPRELWEIVKGFWYDEYRFGGIQFWKVSLSGGVSYLKCNMSTTMTFFGASTVAVRILQCHLHRNQLFNETPFLAGGLEHECYFSPIVGMMIQSD